MPRIEEVNRIIEILTSIGLKITWLADGKLEIINPGHIYLDSINSESYGKNQVRRSFNRRLVFDFQ